LCGHALTDLFRFALQELAIGSSFGLLSIFHNGTRFSYDCVRSDQKYRTRIAREKLHNPVPNGPRSIAGCAGQSQIVTDIYRSLRNGLGLGAQRVKQFSPQRRRDTEKTRVKVKTGGRRGSRGHRDAGLSGLIVSEGFSLRLCAFAGKVVFFPWMSRKAATPQRNISLGVVSLRSLRLCERSGLYFAFLTSAISSGTT
jgi:hypothetical protein